MARSIRALRPRPRWAWGATSARAVEAADREMPPAAVIGDDEIGIAPPGDVDNTGDGVTEPRGDQPEMPGFAAFCRGKDDAAALADGSRAQQRRRFAVTTSFVEGTALQAAQLLQIRDARGREIAGRLLRRDLDRRVERHQPVRDRTCSTTSMPCAVSASCLRFDIETQRSMRRMPSQWKTSGISS